MNMDNSGNWGVVDITRRINLGCGRNIMPGWINVDSAALPGVDIVTDLDNCDAHPLPIESDSIDEFLLSHLIEHIHRPLPLMQELWRIAKPGAHMTIRVPYGASDDAWTDPTHVRPYFDGSFGYFSQPFYWRADYGYRGDWQPEKITLVVPAAGRENLRPDQILDEIRKQRNVVLEMIAELVCIKPAREASQALQKMPHINIGLV